LFSYLILTHKDGIDFVLYSGDTPVHAVWETTPEGNIDILNTTYQLIRQYLPNAKVCFVLLTLSFIYLLFFFLHLF
jgi:hypothetical protein